MFCRQIDKYSQVVCKLNAFIDVFQTQNIPFLYLSSIEHLKLMYIHVANDHKLIVSLAIHKHSHWKEIQFAVSHNKMLIFMFFLFSNLSSQWWLLSRYLRFFLYSIFQCKRNPITFKQYATIPFYCRSNLCRDKGNKEWKFAFDWLRS